MQSRHPLPKRPNVGGSQPPQSQPAQPPQARSNNASGGYAGYANNAWGGYAQNASGGYPGNASGGYAGYGGYQANASGGYPAYNTGGGYPGYNASGGYSGYNASGGYPGYGNASGGYPSYGQAAPYANPYAASGPSTSTSTSTSTQARRGGARQRCSHAGCNFSALPDALAAHEASHSIPAKSGGKSEGRSEEEERWAKSGRVAYIQGTGIKLDTPEEIEAWIKERKSKFPTFARVAQRKEEEAEAVARGENPRKRKLDPARAAEEWGREAPPPRPDQTPFQGWDVSARGGRGRGRGRGGAATRGGRPAPAAKAESSDESSSEESDSSSDISSDSEEEADAPKTDDADVEEKNVEKDDGQEEDEDKDEDEDEEGKEKEESKPVKDVCRFFARGKCRYGARCKLSHDTGPQSDDKDAKAADGTKKEDKKGPPKPPAPRQPPGKKANPFARPSFLGALLANPIEQTLSQLTQTVRFLVANDMLRGVETRAGEAEEQRLERERIMVVEEGNEGGALGEGEGRNDGEAEGGGPEAREAVEPVVAA